jgi:hypothetical protein
VRTGFWWGTLEEMRPREDLGADGRITSKWVFNKYNGVWIKLIWLSIGISDGLL